jgi:hypothetical protein
MRKLTSIFLTVLAVAGFFMATERRALAYADPGSSLLLLQTAGSVLTAGAIYFRRKIYGWFHRGKFDATEVESETETASGEGALNDGR